MKYLLTIAIGALVALGSGRADEAKVKILVDNDFLIQCAEHCHSGVEYSKLAEKRSQNEQVKAFAAEVVNEGTEAKKMIGKEFKERKIGVVTGTGEGFRKEYDRLAALEGKEFDREYLKRMVEDGKNTNKLFDGQVSGGKDEVLTGQAKEMKKAHAKCLDKAEKLLDSVK